MSWEYEQFYAHFMVAKIVISSRREIYVDVFIFWNLIKLFFFVHT